jgi:twinkle protein
MLTNADLQAFENRGLDAEVADRMGARFQNGKFLFEYRRDGELQFRKGRSEDKRFWIEPKGAKLQFWNLDQVPVLPSRPSEPLVICEGEFDAIAVAQCFGGYVLSVPNGVAGNRSEGEIVIAEDTRFSYLWQNERLLPQIEQFNQVILCTDGDDPGMVLRDELALRIGEPRCWYVTYPVGTKDANDVLMQRGEAGVKALLQGARPMRPGHLARPSDIPPKRNEIAYSSGWGFMDRHLMVIRPELMVVTGEPGHGKGQWVRALTFHLAEAHGWRTAYLTPEDPSHRLKRDMRRFAFRNNRYANQEQQRAAIDWIDNHFRISTPPEDEPITLDMVMNEMESAALHHNCQVFVIDPWNEIEHDLSRGETETLYIERALRAFKRKTRRLNLLLIIVAHPRKQGKDESVTLWSINGSANWRNKADHGIIIKRESEYSTDITLTVEKCKDHETMGVPGDVFMAFKKDLCDYHQMAGNSGGE